MCFAPYISLSTFIIEFLLATYFLLQNPKDKLNKIIALTSFLLGIYQLNEFLICVTKINLFTKLAISTTAILPVLAISIALVMSRKKIKYYWKLLIYSPAAFFILAFTMSNTLTQSATCSTVFIEYPIFGLLGKFFALYYLVSANTKSKHEKVLSGLGMLGMFIFTIPTYIFLLFLPALDIKFPSVLCEFALLLAIEFIFLLWYKEEHKLKY